MLDVPGAKVNQGQSVPLFHSVRKNSQKLRGRKPSKSRPLPREIIERVERVTEYHRSTRLTPESVRTHPTVLDAATKPNPYRRFADLPVVPLPTKLLDAPVAAVPLLSEGVGAVAEEQLCPPQDLRTLASWLFLANGLAAKSETPTSSQWLRTCPSSGALYPCEIYVAAFAIAGLEPGLYHYNLIDFTLSKMREGDATLATIKRGRPDLNFLKSVPAAILVSTIYCAVGLAISPARLSHGHARLRASGAKSCDDRQRPWNLHQPAA